MNAMALINAALAAPKTHSVVTRFADGRERRFDTRCIGSAENHAVGERRKIGRDLIDRLTGDTVRVVSVEIEPIQIEDTSTYELVDSDGTAVGCGTPAQLVEYIANGWVAPTVRLGKALA